MKLNRRNLRWPSVIGNNRNPDYKSAASGTTIILNNNH